LDKQVGSWDIYPLVLSPDGDLRPDVGIEVHLTAELVDWEEQTALQPELLRFETSAMETVAWPVMVLELTLSRTLVHYWDVVLYILLGLVTYVRLVGLPLVSGDAAEAIASLDDELPEEIEEENSRNPD
jgi:hypothetical protein